MCQITREYPTTRDRGWNHQLHWDYEWKKPNHKKDIFGTMNWALGMDWSSTDRVISTFGEVHHGLTTNLLYFRWYSIPQEREISRTLRVTHPFVIPPIHICLELIGVSANWVSLLQKSSEWVGLITKWWLTPNWPHSSPLRVFFNIVNPPKILHGPLKLSFSIQNLTGSENEAYIP